jgi:hypothetical protein
MMAALRFHGKRRTIHPDLPRVSRGTGQGLDPGIEQSLKRLRLRSEKKIPSAWTVPVAMARR